MPWQRGPLPPNTYQYGAVVTVDTVKQGGFLYADFRGDHVITTVGNGNKRIEPHEVLWFDNSIELPIPKA